MDMGEVTVREREGLFDRLQDIIGLVEMIPNEFSDEESEGIIRVVPTDLKKTLRAFWAPRVRSTSQVFFKMLNSWMQGARRAKAEGKKVFLVPFNFPVELIHCFEGAWPITSEMLSTIGVAVLEGQGERYWDYAMGMGFPEFSCSANMIEVGSVLTESDFRPDAIISDCFGSCDINSLTHGLLARYLDIPLLFIEKTVDNSERGIRQYHHYYETLVEEIEEFLGERLDEERMREVLSLANQATELYWELWDLHKFKPCPVPNAFALFTYGTRYSMWGREEGLETLRSMVETSKQRLENGEYPAEEEVARSIWCYTGYYFDMFGFFNWMEENGITYLGDGLDLVFPQVIDTTSRQTMITGLAETCRNMCMTRQMGADSMSAQWVDDCIWAAREQDPDCFIYCGHHSCKQTWSGAAILRKELMKRAGIPTLILQGDAWIKRMTPMSALQETMQEFVTNVLKERRTAARKVG